MRCIEQSVAGDFNTPLREMSPNYYFSAIFAWLIYDYTCHKPCKMNQGKSEQIYKPEPSANRNSQNWNTK